MFDIDGMTDLHCLDSRVSTKGLDGVNSVVEESRPDRTRNGHKGESMDGSTEIFDEEAVEGIIKRTSLTVESTRIDGDSISDVAPPA
jgi:hypothetical protein